MNSIIRRFVFVFFLLGGAIPQLLAQDRLSQIDKYRAEAEVLYEAEKTDEALQRYTLAYQLALKIDVNRAANLGVDISTIYFDEGNFEKAVQICLTSLHQLENTQPRLDTVRFKLHSSLGTYYKKLRNREACLSHFEVANKLLNRQPVLEKLLPEYVIYHYNNQGTMHLQWGSLDAALMFIQKAMDLAMQAQMVNDFAILSNNLAHLYEKLGYYQQANVYWEKALNKYAKNDLKKCLMYSALGKSQMSHDNPNEAKHFFEKATQLYESLLKEQIIDPNPDFEALLANNFGECYRRLNRYDISRKYFQKTRQIWQTRYGLKSDCIVLSYLGEGLCYEKEHQLEKSLLAYQQALAANTTQILAANQNPAPQQVLFEHLAIETLTAKAHVQYMMYQKTTQEAYLIEAFNTYKRTIEIAQKFRQSFSAIDMKILWSSQFYVACQEALQITYLLYEKTKKQEYFSAFFEFLENSQSTSMLDIWQTYHLKNKYLPEAELEKEKQLRSEINRLITQLAKSKNSAIEDSIYYARQKMSFLQKRLEAEYPAYANAKHFAQNITFSKLTDKLDQKSALIYYRWVHQQLYVMVVTKEKTELKRILETDKDFTDIFVSLQNELRQNPLMNAYQGSEQAQKLFRWLFSPIEKLLKNKTHLIVVRDVALSTLPFEVLERQKEEYLVYEYAIIYAYSATHWATQQGVEPLHSGYKVLAIAPFTQKSRIENNNHKDNLTTLVASESEARQIGDYILRDEQASKQNFLMMYQRYPVLHFATHAIANDSLPQESYIAFYPHTSFKTGHQLRSTDLLELDLHANRLICLSACATAHGKQLTGEGMMSLATTINYAGCPAVAATLWKAHDESMAQITSLFHEYLREGNSMDDALRLAKISFLRSEQGQKYAHPYFWAGLILIGDGTPLCKPNRWTTYLLGGVLVALVVLALTIVYHKNFKTNS